jgi:hypothetical protein
LGRSFTDLRIIGEVQRP